MKARKFIFLSFGLLLVIAFWLPGCRTSTAKLPIRAVAEPTGATVEVVATGDGYTFYRNGQPYYAKGGAGRSFLPQLAAAGGNSIRTWTEFGADTLLDRCQELGITVGLTIHLGKERDGFDFSDTALIARQRERVAGIVNQFKDHPALLYWCLGNEVDLYQKDPRTWEVLNDLIQMVHTLDPNHPVTTAISGVRDGVGKVVNNCRELDFLAINLFESVKEVRERMAFGGWEGPYLISEWSSHGWWETTPTHWDAPVEYKSNDKAENLARVYQAGIQNNPRCIGEYVFYWGQKQERTHTWFSLLSEKGEKTPSVDQVSKFWTGQWPENRAPQTERLLLEGQVGEDMVYLHAGETYRAQIAASDPDGDTLSFEWDLRLEGQYRDKFGGDAEPIPPSFPQLLLQQRNNLLTFRAPEKPGAYRLFVYVRDGQGNFSYDNVPFFVTLGKTNS